MFCKQCGAQQDENQKFCGNCGAKLENDLDLNGAANMYNQNTYNPQMAGENGLVPPMKWYKFLIYFSLFLGAVLNVFAGISCMTGAHYSGDAAVVYAFIRGLRVTDILFGIVCIGLAALMIYTRFQLSKYRKNAPKLIILVYVLSSALSLLYLLASWTIMYFTLSKFGMSVTETISAFIQPVMMCIISGAVMVSLNYIYFKKRQHLFVN